MDTKIPPKLPTLYSSNASGDGYLPRPGRPTSPLYVSNSNRILPQLCSKQLLQRQLLTDHLCLLASAVSPCSHPNSPSHSKLRDCPSLPSTFLSHTWPGSHLVFTARPFYNLVALPMLFSLASHLWQPPIHSLAFSQSFFAPRAWQTPQKDAKAPSINTSDFHLDHLFLCLSPV